MFLVLVAQFINHNASLIQKLFLIYAENVQTNQDYLMLLLVEQRKIVKPSLNGLYIVERFQENMIILSASVKVEMNR